MKEISLYIHIPFCLKKCRYCNFYSVTHNSKSVPEYIRTLAKEIGRFRGNNYLVTSIYLGGGTPSLLSFEQLFSIFSAIIDSFKISKDAEVTIETNPATVTKQKAKGWRILGINRVSIGAQTFIEDELQILGRLHSASDISKSFECILSNCTENISLDFMYGISGQTQNSWEESLHKAVELQPKHISSYCLSLEKGTPFFEMKDQLSLPDEDTQQKMYYSMVSFLEANDFQQYEISNFAIDGYESRHNISYWMGKEYLGFGAAAHSFYNMTRKENIADVQRYINAIQNNQSVVKSKKEISGREYISDLIFLRLRLRTGISLTALRNQYGFDVKKEYRNTINKFSQHGYLTIEGDRLKLSRKAFFVSDEILSEFV